MTEPELTADPQTGARVRVELPYQLRLLAQISGEVRLPVSPPVTQRSLFTALEDRYPALRGAIRDAATGRRRPLVRLFACETDLSNHSPDDPLPSAVAEGREPLLVVGAIAGG